MVKFTLKMFVWICFFFIGILVGMQQANKGMLEMKGYEDETFTTPVYWQEREDGKVEAAFLGNEVTQFDLEEKRKKLEETETYNFFSSIGKAFAEMVTAIFQTLIQWISSLI
jgi:hypothetical protein